MPSISINSRKMYYEEYGEGFPVLFGHSYLWDARMWEPQVEHLSPSYRCIIPEEIWGHGRSGPVDAEDCSIESLARDHLSLIESLGIESCAVVGLSVGGMWTAHLALERPDVVKALVLMDTFVGPEPAETQKRYFGMLDMVEQAGVIPPQLIEQILPLFFSSKTPAAKPLLVERFHEHLTSMISERIPGIVALGRAIFSRTSVLERLGELRIPALIVVGEDDRSRPPHEARLMADRIPNARLSVIPEAGHICNLEKPEEVNGLLEQFLNDNIMENR